MLYWEFCRKGHILVINVCPWWKACIFSKIDVVINWKPHIENHLLHTKSMCRSKCSPFRKRHITSRRSPNGPLAKILKCWEKMLAEMCACLSNWSSCTRFLNSQTKTLLTWEAQLKGWSENTELPTQWFKRERDGNLEGQHRPCLVCLRCRVFCGPY